MSRGVHERGPGDRPITVWVTREQYEFLHSRPHPEGCSWREYTQQDLVRIAVDRLMATGLQPPKVVTKGKKKG